MSQKPEVFYVDDDAEDLLLFEDALQTTAPEYKLATASNGFEALKYLDEKKDNPPCMVILDLNMPAMSGKEVMKKIKENPEFNNLPVVVFTTSANPNDKNDCAQYGVDMITKPITFSELKETIKLLITYC